MEIKTKLMNKFKSIIDVYYEKEDKNNFLRVVTSFKKMQDIEKLSHEVSEYLDEINYGDNSYYLNIFSSGATLDEKELQSLSEE